MKNKSLNYLSPAIITIAKHNLDLIISILEKYDVINYSMRPLSSQSNSIYYTSSSSAIISSHINQSWNLQLFIEALPNIIQSLESSPISIQYSIEQQINFIIQNKTYLLSVNSSTPKNVSKLIDDYISSLSNTITQINTIKSNMLSAFNESNFPKYDALSDKIMPLISKYNKIISILVSTSSEFNVNYANILDLHKLPHSL